MQHRTIEEVKVGQQAPQEAQLLLQMMHSQVFLLDSPSTVLSTPCMSSRCAARSYWSSLVPRLPFIWSGNETIGEDMKYITTL